MSLASLAEEVGVNERTLRRAVNQGTLRGVRPTPRRLELPLSERRYVQRSWSLLSSLRAALRTEQNVRLALLFGSASTGTDTPASDVDLLVDLRDASFERVVDLNDKLTTVVGRQVDVIRLEDAEADPLFLVDVVSEGRVLVDRAALWPQVVSRTAAMRSRSRKQELQRAHLEDFPRQYAALQNAMAAFGDSFDLEPFQEAFATTDDMDAYNRVQAVERATSRVQTFVADLAQAAVKLAQLPLPPMGAKGSPAQRAFEALRAAGVIDGALCRRLTRAQKALSTIEHGYVQTNAGDVHRTAELVYQAARDFLAPYRAWIAPYLEADTPDTT